MPRPLRPLTPHSSPRDYFGAELRRLRNEAELSLDELGQKVHYSGAQIAAVEKAQRWPKPELAKALDNALATDGTFTRLLPLVESQRASLGTDADSGAGDAYDLDGSAQLRRDVTDIVAGEALSGASLEDWERIIGQHGQATRYKPSGLLLRDLILDFTELRRLLERRRPASTVRALTRTAAQLAGLMSLTLIKLGRPIPAKEWARTARLAADEAADPIIQSWVRSQDAYIDYYRGAFPDALTTAADAQTVAGAAVSVGAALGAALEARAHAALDRREESWRALGRAEEILGGLTADWIMPSAFGYSEAQLRFHTGNALTRLGNHDAALVAQERALELYPEDDYMDRALVRLDQARCMAAGGDPCATLAHATAALAELDDERRKGLIALYAQELLASLPLAGLPSSAVREFQELLRESA